jgi:hypothetical protein
VGQDGSPPRLSLEETADQLGDAYQFVLQRGYLQRSFGYDCVDAGDVAGLHGSDIRKVLYLDAGLKCEGALADFIRKADEVALFTIIEFVYEQVAKPASGAGWVHAYGGCGFHTDANKDEFEEDAGRVEWRQRVNKFLRFYADGFELSPAGEMVRITPDGLTPLSEAPAPSKAPPTDRDKVMNAVHTFRLAKSTREQRKQAVRQLADVLEFHREQVRKP